MQVLFLRIYKTGRAGSVKIVCPALPDVAIMQIVLLSEYRFQLLCHLCLYFLCGFA